MFPTKVVDKIKTHILCSVTPPPPPPSYKYLGSTVNSDNSIEEEVQCRITLGNEAYYTNQFLFNPLTPNDPYRGRTAPLTSKVAFYIFIQQI